MYMTFVRVDRIAVYVVCDDDHVTFERCGAVSSIASGCSVVLALNSIAVGDYNQGGAVIKSHRKRDSTR